MAPHSLTLTMVGTGLLWVGWFGFNAGSALEANGSAALAMINTFVATASAGLFWMLAERVSGHKGSALGFCSGIIAGLVAVTPAAGNSGPFGAIVLGAIASIVCFVVVTIVKPKLGYDDSLDAFGIHGVGGIVGAIGTAVVYAPSLGGPGAADYDMGAKLVVQLLAVGTTIVWAAIGTAIAFFVAKARDRWPRRSRSRARRARPRRTRRTRLQLLTRGSSCGRHRGRHHRVRKRDRVARHFVSRERRFAVLDQFVAVLRAVVGHLDVQIGDAERVFLDELAARLHDVAHQAREDFVGNVGLIDYDASIERFSGSSVVSHNCSAFISPRPL